MKERGENYQKRTFESHTKGHSGLLKPWEEKLVEEGNYKNPHFYLDTCQNWFLIITFVFNFHGLTLPEGFRHLLRNLC